MDRPRSFVPNDRLEFTSIYITSTLLSQVGDKRTTVRGETGSPAYGSVLEAVTLLYRIDRAGACRITVCSATLQICIVVVAMIPWNLSN